jgi:cysteine desulfurase
MLGGGHEGGLRSGTENVMGAVAFACAACARAELFAREPRALLDRRARLLALLRERAPDLVEVAPASEREQLGSILSVAFPGARARTLLTALEERGVLVGSGSACHGSGEQKISPVLQAIGCAPELAGAVLRFSMSGTESEADLLRAAEALASARDALARAPARRV